MASGEILELSRYPVKSMRGEGLTATRLSAHGVGGDRIHAVFADRDGESRRLTAREAPRLLAWHAEYPFSENAALKPEDPPTARVTAPSGHSWQWGDPRLRSALEDELGHRVALRRDPAGIHDVPNTVLVTTEATRAALEAALGSRLDVRRFRPNLHLALDAEPWEELGWAGATLRFSSGVTLRLTKPCLRCVIPTRDPHTQEKWPQLLEHLAQRHDRQFGIYGRVTTGGRLALGEAAEIVRPAAR